MFTSLAHRLTSVCVPVCSVFTVTKYVTLNSQSKPGLVQPNVTCAECQGLDGSLLGLYQSKWHKISQLEGKK